MARALQRMTVEEFEAWADERPERYELVDGSPRMMAGATEPHGEMQTRLTVEIDRRLKPPCRVLGSVGLVLDRHNERVPDLAIVCGERQEKRLSEARAVIEILSEGTAEYDLGEKRLRYMQLSGLEEIWIVWPGHRQVQLWRKDADGRWRGEDVTGAEAIRSALLLEPLPLEALYGPMGR
ncbi:MAG: Uma2 family endonuclease [Geminicoccaceae bacterium]|nr:Uma2 family endonuclease [Geminicoccaceae bacterium]MDW8370902.1 Uma2 family endonuclease [Geminicoccaceae bacterium]